MASIALPPALLVMVLALLGGTLVALIAFVVVASAVGVWVVTGADARVRRAFGGRPADRIGEARALNLLEGLGFTAGLRPPELLVVDETGANIAVWGRRPSAAVVAVTSGLLGCLSRIQLEGVLAAALVEIRSGELGAATLVASLPGVGRRLVRSAQGRDEATDAAAVGLTRFPPGLASALDAIAATGSSVTAGGPDRAHLWLVDPSPVDAPSGQRSRPGDRAEALREL